MRYRDPHGTFCFPRANCRAPLFLYARNGRCGWGCDVEVGKSKRHPDWTIVFHMLRLGRIAITTRGRWFPPGRGT